MMMSVPLIVRLFMSTVLMSTNKVHPTATVTFSPAKGAAGIHPAVPDQVPVALHVTWALTVFVKQVVMTNSVIKCLKFGANIFNNNLICFNSKNLMCIFYFRLLWTVKLYIISLDKQGQLLIYSQSLYKLEIEFCILKLIENYLKNPFFQSYHGYGTLKLGE